MTALVPETLDATAGRAQRTGLWGGAAWRWSLLAGLGLHMVLFAAWWGGAQRAEPVVLQVPMQVRMAVQAVAAQPGRPNEAPSGAPGERANAAQTAPPTMVPPLAPVPSRGQVGSTRTQAPAAAVPRPLPSTAPVEPPLTVAKAATVATAAPDPHPTPTTTSVITGGNTPNAVQAPQAPTVSAAATHKLTGEPADGADRDAAPVEVSSSSVAYLVKPELTFPPGSEDLGEFGSVTLRVLVDVQGGVSAVQRLKSSGYARLDQHAAKVIRRARFQPHQVNGMPRAMWVTIPVNFNPP